MTSPNVFISYRRKDTAPYAGRIHDDLGERFGKGRIFMDLTIQPGEDFTRVLDDGIRSSAVFLVIIGPNWLRPPPPDPDPEDLDWVSVEVSLALSRDILVIPVLVGGAHMPRTKELPEPIKALAKREALEITDSRWDYDLGRLIQRLQPVLEPEPTVPDGAGAEGEVNGGAGGEVEPVRPPTPKPVVPKAVWIGGGAVALVAVVVILVASLAGGGGQGGAALTTPGSGSFSPTSSGSSRLGDRELRFDDTGDDVLELQTKLLSFGFDPGSVDGSFGSATTAAVKGFQFCVGLAGTGVVDSATAEAIIRGPTVPGTAGVDHLSGTSGPDVIFGREGDDTIDGLEGDDVICGGNGNDVLTGGPGNDRITGAGEDDRVEGGAGSDILGGGPGNDHVDGGGCCGDPSPSDQDQIFGGPGNDELLAATAGSATIQGEAGTDTCPPDSADVVVSTCE